MKRKKKKGRTQKMEKRKRLESDNTEFLQEHTI